MDNHKNTFMKVIEIEAEDFTYTILNEAANDFAKLRASNCYNISDAKPVVINGKLYYTFTIRVWKDRA